MKGRKAKSKAVLYIPAGEMFVATDGKTYKPVPDTATHDICQRCDFRGVVGLCVYHQCLGEYREDGIGVHFKRVDE